MEGERGNGDGKGQIELGGRRHVDGERWEGR